MFIFFEWIIKIFYCVYWGDKDLPRWLNIWNEGRFLNVSQDLFSKSTTARISLKSPAIYITPYITKNKLIMPCIKICNKNVLWITYFFYINSKY